MQNIDAKYEQIAASMGSGWTIKKVDGVSCLCNTKKTHNYGFQLIVSGDKIRVIPIFPKDKLGRYVYFDKKIDSIQISANKDANRIASDIKNRILDDYNEIFNCHMERVEESNRYIDQQRKSIETIEKVSGGKIRKVNGDISEFVDVDMGTNYHDVGYIKTLCVGGGVEIDFRSLPVDIAVKILQTWREISTDPSYLLKSRCKRLKIVPMDFSKFIDSSHRDDHQKMIKSNDIDEFIDYLINICKDSVEWIDEIVGEIVKGRNSN